MFNLIYQPYFALFIIIFLGILLGKLRINGISLGSSAIIIIALIFGHFAVVLPVAIEKIGLILFIFAVGIQAGPGFFDSFRTGEAKQYLLPVALSIFIAATLSILFCKLLGLPNLMAAGVFTGVTTNTASLAAISEINDSTIPIFAYSISYPLSMIVTVIFLKVIPLFIKLDIKAEEEAYKLEVETHYPKLHARHFIVENPGIINKEFSTLKMVDISGAKITRVKKKGEAEGHIPHSGLVLGLGDHVKAIGPAQSLATIGLLIGKETAYEIPLSKQTEVKWILISQKSVVGKRLQEINLDELWKAYISRIRRAGIDIIPHSHTRLRFGDKVLVSSNSSTLPNVIKTLGGTLPTEIDFLPIALSIILGILVGQLKVPLAQLNLGPGVAGGILIMTLLLGRLGKTGPLLWSIAGPTNQFLRQLGILLFLAGVGTRTGKYIINAFSMKGLLIALGSIFITFITLSLVSFVTLKFGKMNKLKFLGSLAGSMTCAPGLTSINEVVPSDIPGPAYSITFPFALLGTIIVAQLLALLPF